jgi:hypothetical protein
MPNDKKMKRIITIVVTMFLSLNLFCQIEETTVDLNDTVFLNLYRVRFDSTGRKFEYYDSKYPFSIDGIPIFGTDGEMPKYQLIKATLSMGNILYDLQIDNMYNPWFGDTPNNNLFKLTIDGTQIHLRGFFSDGAGSYAAEWLMIGRSSIRTILTNEEWIFDEELNKR